ncbi:hypothetical protein [Streptomyces melanogenes]|uniref:hypothetical protein n=1 Tax=Streptomyces melanogenes TaxID=67326 RepID=UPI00167D9DEB|nr:hypothetical protein [Streptomyces melanogenes]GGP93326.1 hypothetical protein GCM10010278_84150 [Streptomyces melanogenes]
MAHERQDIWVDFGLSGLTKWFHGPWGGEATPREIVMAAADWGSGAYAPTLAEDALRLLQSPLPTRVIGILWYAATGGNYDLDRLGIDSRAWLHEIVDACAERIRQDDSSFTPDSPGPAPNALRDEVLAEIRALGPDMDAATSTHPHHPAPDVVPALEQVVTQVDADLGFRLFLRVMKAYRVPIDESRYDRYHELGERFGYNEFVVDDGDLYVRPDMN